MVSTDPKTNSRVEWTPYNFVRANPIINVDPTGALDTEYDKDGNKVSDLGGDKIDFKHQPNGDTKIVDRSTGASNTIAGGEKLIKGYTLRDKSTGWAKITGEFATGTGPTNSMLADFDNSSEGAFGSLHSMLSSYTSLARDASLNSVDTKGVIKMDYVHANPVVAKDMWEQMWGRSNISWYKVGDKTLFFMADSKSSTSLLYRLAPNWERSSGKVLGNTRQTYIWIESNTDVQNKVREYKAYIDKEFQKILDESKRPMAGKI